MGMSAKKAKIKILKSKINKNLKNEVLEANIEYISTTNPTSTNDGNSKTTRKRKTTAEIVIEAINKTVPTMINNALNKSVPIMINDALKPVVRELESLRTDFNTIVEVNNLKTK